MPKIPYHGTTVSLDTVTSSGSPVFTASSGSLIDAVSSSGGAYATSSSSTSDLSVSFDDASVADGYMCMGVTVGIRYRGTTPIVRIDSPAEVTYPNRLPIPRDQTFPDSPFDWRTQEFFLQHRPIHTFFDDSQAWDDEDGVIADIPDIDILHPTGGPVLDCDIDHVYLIVHSRETITRDEILSSMTYDSVQCMQIEGIPYIFTDKPLTDVSDNSDDTWFDSYGYFGIQHKLVHGVMKTMPRLYGGRISFSKGRVEEEGGSVSLIDLDRVWHERRLDVSGVGRTKIETYYDGGFVSWLLAYGDRTNFGNSRLADSSSYNTGAALEPENGLNGLGFAVEDDSDLDFDTSAGDEYVYTNKECIYVGSDSTDYQSLGRGQFGSLNAFHGFDLVTGLGPLVSKHPYIWNGRWVRIWNIPLDQHTGFPLPVRASLCQTMIWGGHEQVIGTGSNEYRINLQPFTRLLEQEIGNAPAVQMEYINFRDDQRIGIFIDGESVLHQATLPAGIYKDVTELKSELNSQLNGITALTHTGCRFGEKGGVTVFLANMRDKAINLSMTPDLAYCLGFTSDNDKTKLFMEQSSETVLVYHEQQVLAKNPPLSVFQSYEVLNPRVAASFESTLEDWVSTGYAVSWGPIGKGSSGRTYSGLDFSDGRNHRYTGRSITTDEFYDGVSTDSDGIYIQAEIPAPPEWAKHTTQKDKKGIGAIAGMTPPTIRPVAYHENVSFHEMALSHMLSTGWGANGDYDVLSRYFGLGIRQELVDTDKFEWMSYRMDALGRREYPILESIKFSNIIYDEFKMPVGVAISQDSLGRLTLIDSSTIAARTSTLKQIGPDDIVRGSPIVCRTNQEGIHNHIELHLDYDYQSEKYLKKLVAVEPNSVRQYGTKKMKIESKSLKSQLDGQTQSIYSQWVGYSRAFFNQFAFEVPELTVKTLQSTSGLKPGDSVVVNIPDVSDVTDFSSDGIVNKPCRVLSIDKDIVSGVNDIRLTYDRAYSNKGGWAPAMKIGSFATPATVLPVETNNYCPSSAVNGFEQLETSDLKYFSVGDEITLIESQVPVPTTQTVGIVSINHATSEITVDATVAVTYSEGYAIFPYDALLVDAQKDDGYIFNDLDFTLSD